MIDLTEKQHRIAAWSRYIKENTSSPKIQVHFAELLQSYKNLIASCWESDAVNPKQADEILELETKLEQAFEESRYCV